MPYIWIMSSQSKNQDLLLSLYKSTRSVFSLIDIIQTCDEKNVASLSKKINYQVKKGNLLNPRKGIYAKPDYNLQALGCRIFIPSYISLETILQEEGIIFQYDSTVTIVSYLSRELNVDGQRFRYRKIKDEILYSGEGIINSDDGISRAIKERAFLDFIYLNGEPYLDSLNTMNWTIVNELLPMYKSKILQKRIERYMNNEYK
jgi:hypothetical protein